MPCVYILRCADDSYYVGSTWDVQRRVHQHNGPAEGAAYTRCRQPVTLVWAWEYASIAEAFAVEKRIQGWSWGKREALIAGDFDVLPQLSRNATQRRLARERERGGPDDGR